MRPIPTNANGGNGPSPLSPSSPSERAESTATVPINTAVSSCGKTYVGGNNANGNGSSSTNATNNGYMSRMLVPMQTAIILLLCGYHFIQTAPRISQLEGDLERAEAQTAFAEQSTRLLKDQDATLKELMEQKKAVDEKLRDARAIAERDGKRQEEAWALAAKEKKRADDAEAAMGRGAASGSNGGDGSGGSSDSNNGGGGSSGDRRRRQIIAKDDPHMFHRTRSLTLDGGDQEKVKALLYRFDQPANLTDEMINKWGGYGYDRDYPGEEGWVHSLKRSFSRTSFTTYDPKKDELPLPPNSKETAPRFIYSRSPVPKNSWEVRLPNNKVITMDDIAFAYDIWYEDTKMFTGQGWMGVFCQQDPSDGYAIADMLWRVKPDLIIEVGTNNGGGAIFYSTFMRAYNPNGKIVTLDIRNVSNWMPTGTERCVGCTSAVDHPWWHDGMINFILGDVTTPEIQKHIEEEYVSKAKTVLVIEDASHFHPGTLHNMEAVMKWVTKGSYLLVQDTKMDRFMYGRWMYHGSLGPMLCVDQFIKKHGDKFAVDRRFEYFMYSQHHRGWLRRK